MVQVLRFAALLGWILTAVLGWTLGALAQDTSGYAPFGAWQNIGPQVIGPGTNQGGSWVKWKSAAVDAAQPRQQAESGKALWCITQDPPTDGSWTVVGNGEGWAIPCSHMPSRTTTCEGHACKDGGPPIWAEAPSAAITAADLFAGCKVWLPSPLQEWGDTATVELSSLPSGKITGTCKIQQQSHFQDAQ